MMLTAGVVKFSAKNALVLSIASVCSIAGFVWPFFYAGKDLPRTQFFFLIAIIAAFILPADGVSAVLPALIALVYVLVALVLLRPQQFNSDFNSGS